MYIYISRTRIVFYLHPRWLEYVCEGLWQVGPRLRAIGPAIPIFVGRVGAASSASGGWPAIANVACKSEVYGMSFANIFTSNMSLSESGRLRW